MRRAREGRHGGVSPRAGGGGDPQKVRIALFLRAYVPYGTKRTFQDVGPFVRFRATADIHARVASTASVVNDPKRTSAGSKSCSAACPVVASWTASLPRIPHRAGAGVGGGVRGKLAVELGGQYDAVRHVAAFFSPFGILCARELCLATFAVAWTRTD